MSDLPDILIIEDNDFVRLQIARFLSDAGYAVFEADNANDGMDILIEKRESIGAILVDIRMEPVDGFGFIMKMQADNISKPVILVTGDQNPDLLAKASHMGVSSVLMKPVNKDRLVKMVERTIATHKRTL